VFGWIAGAVLVVAGTWALVRAVSKRSAAAARLAGVATEPQQFSAPADPQPAAAAATVVTANPLGAVL
jgi:hypothetical protein